MPSCTPVRLVQQPSLQLQAGDFVVGFPSPKCVKVEESVHVLKGEYGREEACVRGVSVVVQVVVPSNTRTWSCLKLNYQPSA